MSTATAKKAPKAKDAKNEELALDQSVVPAAPEATDSPAKSDKPMVKAEQIIEPQKFYRLGHIETALGIPRRLVLDAYDEHRYKVFSTNGHRESPELFEITGNSLLYWINNFDVDYEVSEISRRVHKLGEYEEKEKSPPEPAKPNTVLGEAIELAEKEKQTESKIKQQWLDETWALYRQILHRMDSPAANDAKNLATIMIDFKLDSKQVAADRAIVQKAEKLTTMHENRQAAQAEVVRRRAPRDAFEKESERRKRELWKAVIEAEGESRLCGEAAFKLVMLSREQPRLFDNSTDPPRLHCPKKHE